MAEILKSLSSILEQSRTGNALFSFEWVIDFSSASWNMWIENTHAAEVCLEIGSSQCLSIAYASNFSMKSSVRGKRSYTTGLPEDFAFKSHFPKYNTQIGSRLSTAGKSPTVSLRDRCRLLSPKKITSERGVENGAWPINHARRDLSFDSN